MLMQIQQVLRNSQWMISEWQQFTNNVNEWGWSKPQQRILKGNIIN